jgi:hypothetical protein
MSTEGVDFANARPSGSRLVSAGKDFVIRYTSPDTSSNPNKNLDPSEVTNYRNAGLDIGLVWETTENRATQGHSAGVADAQAAEEVRRARGFPSSVAQYMVAQDVFGITGPQVVAYFQGVADVIGLARTGAYGGYDIIKYLFDHQLITFGWQTYAWSSGRWDSRAQVQQYHNGVTVAGVTVDLDRAMVANWGQWSADNTNPSPPVIPPEDDMPTADEIATATVDKLLSASVNASGLQVKDALQSSTASAQLNTVLGSSGPNVGVALQSTYQMVSTILTLLTPTTVASVVAQAVEQLPPGVEVTESMLQAALVGAVQEAASNGTLK